MRHGARTVIDLAPGYYFITMGSRHSRSLRGGQYSPAKPKCGVACAKTNSGVVFYSADLSLPGARSLHYLEAFARGAIPHPGCSCINRYQHVRMTPKANLTKNYRNHVEYYNQAYNPGMHSF